MPAPGFRAVAEAHALTAIGNTSMIRLETERLPLRSR